MAWVDGAGECPATTTALERNVISLWLDAGYSRHTIETRIQSVRAIYRILRRDTQQDGEDRIARWLTCANVTAAARRVARRRRGNTKLMIRIIKAALRAWADALRLLGKRIPPWKQPPRTASSRLIWESWTYARKTRALTDASFNSHRLYIGQFLDYLRCRKIPLRAITLSDVDRFLATLTTRRHLALTTVGNVCICLRIFFGFLYRTKRISADLAPAVMAPSTRQMHKRPPKATPWRLLKRVFDAIDRRKALGKRDFAIFLTAASYGWGCADVLSLRLDDIDWHRRTLTIVRPKTGVRVEVPLRPQVAHALSSYLQHGRPRNTPTRQVFLRHNGLRAKVPTVSTIGSQLARYATKAGVSLPDHGTKVFRRAHIASQLNRGVPAKVIADVAGHSDTRSLSSYARIQIERLRQCALPVPS